MKKISNLLALPVFSALAFSQLATAADPNPIRDCSSTFKTVPKGTLCREVLDYGMPAQVNGTELRLYRYEDTWTNRPEFLKTLSQISEAATEAVKTFSRFTKVPTIHFFFVNEDGGPNAATTGWETIPCNVTVYFNFDQDPEGAKQAIAHEVFHCIQANAVHLPSSYSYHHSTNWWVEGTADYFSNTVYPKTNREHRDQRKYQVATPLTQQPTPYSTSLFFQFLQNKGKAEPDFLFTELKKQPVKDDPQGSIYALSTWPEIANTFHDFIRAIAQKEIYDSSGSQSPTPNFPVEIGMPLDPQAEFISVPVKPFAYNGTAFELPKGAKVEIRLDGVDYLKGIRVSYRKEGDAGWLQLKPDAPFKAETTCNEDKAKTYEFMVTSTSPEPTQTIKLKQKAEAQSCACQAPKAILDPCIVGEWELDNQATADSLLKWWKAEDAKVPDPHYATDDFLITGNEVLKIASGVSKSSDAYNGHQLRIFQSHRETGKKQVMGHDLEAFLVGTFLQDTDKKLCLKYEAGDGTFTIVQDEFRRTQPVSKFFVGVTTEIEYKCSGNKLELWNVIPGFDNKPFKTLIKKH